jgi:hypothetical protein
MPPTKRGVTALSTKVDQVFIMRLWQELGAENGSDPDHWRAHIRHVNSRQQFYAVGLEKTFNIIRSILIAENNSNSTTSS